MPEARLALKQRLHRFDITPKAGKGREPLSKLSEDLQRLVSEITKRHYKIMPSVEKYLGVPNSFLVDGGPGCAQEVTELLRRLKLPYVLETIYLEKGE